MNDAAAIPEADVQQLAAERAAARAAASAPVDGVVPPPAPSPPPSTPQGAAAPTTPTQGAPPPPPLLTEEAMRFTAECVFNPLFHWRDIEPLDEEELDTVAKGYTPAFNKFAPGLLRDYPELYMFTVATFSIAAPRLKRKPPKMTPEVEAELKRRGWKTPEVAIPPELLRDLERNGWKPPVPVPQAQPEKKEFAA